MELRQCKTWRRIGVWPWLRVSHLFQGSVCGTSCTRARKEFYTAQNVHPPGRPGLINRTVTQTCSQTLTKHEAGGWLTKRGWNAHIATVRYTAKWLQTPASITLLGLRSRVLLQDVCGNRRILDGHPLQSQWLGSSLGESEMNDRGWHTVHDCNEMHKRWNIIQKHERCLKTLHVCNITSFCFAY